MCKYGLKLWNTNTNDYLPLLPDLYKDGFFDYIELYMVPNNSEKIKDWNKINIPFDIHAPHSAHNMNLSDRSKEEYNLSLYKEVKLYADELNARYIVFHGGTNGDYKETARQLGNFNEPRALIENKPYKPLSFVKAKEYTGCKPNEIKYIKNTANSGFCLDIGHAICSGNSFGENVYDFCAEFAKLNPQKLHLSDLDIYSEEDRHLNLGQGNLNFSRIKNILTQVKDITLETAKNSKTDLNDFIEDIKFIKKIMSD